MHPKCSEWCPPEYNPIAKIDYFLLTFQTRFAIYSSKEQMSIIIGAAIQIQKNHEDDQYSEK